MAIDIINNRRLGIRWFVIGARAIILSILLLAFPAAVGAQTIAIVTPDREAVSKHFAEALSLGLEGKVKLLDADLSRSAYESISPASPFNLTSEEAKRLGTVMGCEAFLIVRASNQRRSAFGRPEYYESYAVIYVVSSRTGRLISWRLISREAPTLATAEKLLNGSAGQFVDEIASRIRSSIASEIDQSAPPQIEEVPEEGSPLARNFRPPVPYSRIKPEYTPMAALYEVAATVEASVDLDPTGRVQRIDIVRWAGFGLDESVEKAIRAMNWRPAERSGKPLAMRFLLRYNFKKIDKDPPVQ